MDVQQAIRTRRAVRDFLPDPLSGRQLRKLIHQACWAPSAMNEQPCHFTVITDAATLDEISARAKQWLRKDLAAMPRSGHFSEVLAEPAFHLFYHAPALVVISAPASSRWGIEDCALAAQNLMLSATAQGLGSCWIGFAQGWLNTPDGLRLLGLPEDSRVVAPIILGRPRSAMPPVARKEPAINWIGQYGREA